MTINPITRILRSKASRGLKIIALSLVLVFVSALPVMTYLVFGPEDGNPVWLGRLFAVGALIAHVGFVWGLLLLMKDTYFGRGK